MIVPLNSLSPDSRVWIFQSSRPLASAEIDLLSHELVNFLSSWTAHNQNLYAGFEIKEAWFMTIAVDENHASASGCSIDKLTHFVKSQEAALGVSFFDRLTVLIKSKDEQIKPYSLRAFQDAVKAGSISPSDRSFDNILPTLALYQDQHERPVYQTWLAKYFPQEVLAEI